MSAYGCYLFPGPCTGCHCVAQGPCFQHAPGFRADGRCSVVPRHDRSLALLLSAVTQARPPFRRLVPHFLSWKTLAYLSDSDVISSLCRRYRTVMKKIFLVSLLPGPDTALFLGHFTSCGHHLLHRAPKRPRPSIKAPQSGVNKVEGVVGHFSSATEAAAVEETGGLAWGRTCDQERTEKLL